MGNSVRVLTATGVDHFRSYLARLRRGDSCDLPLELLSGMKSSARLPGGAEIEFEPVVFQSKLDMVVYLSDRFRLVPQAQVDQSSGLWSWLSLYYFDQLCPLNKLGRRTPGQDYRFILDLDFRRWQRHLLFGPYQIYRLHGEKAPLLLYGPLHKTNQYFVELSARQAILTNRGVIEAANLLYFDPVAGKPRRGAGGTVRKGGNLIRFIDVVQQLDLTHDLYSMTGTEVLELLPPEFDRWRPRQKEAKLLLDMFKESTEKADRKQRG